MSKLEIVKTKTTTYTIKQITLDMLTFNETYRRIRGQSRHKMFDCHACNKDFKDGDKISLIITDKGNEVVCHECGIEIQKELEVEK